MAAKSHKAEEIVTKLRQVDVLNAQGKSMAEAIRSIGVMEVTYCEGVRIAVHVSGDVARSRDCVLGVRPEELKVTNTDDAAIKGVIDVVEPTGPDTMVTVRVGGHSVVARAEPRFQGRRGDQVAFKVDPLSINLFDAETENRINTAE